MSFVPCQSGENRTSCRQQSDFLTGFSRFSAERGQIEFFCDLFQNGPRQGDSGEYFQIYLIFPRIPDFRHVTIWRPHHHFIALCRTRQTDTSKIFSGDLHTIEGYVPEFSAVFWNFIWMICCSWKKWINFCLQKATKGNRKKPVLLHNNIMWACHHEYL